MLSIVKKKKKICIELIPNKQKQIYLCNLHNNDNKTFYESYHISGGKERKMIQLKALKKSQLVSNNVCNESFINYASFVNYLHTKIMVPLMS